MNEIKKTMEIREAKEDDISGIVDLLKASLGESLMPKSEEFWRWKHVNNPFGKSPVLLAIDDARIVGVRAFMRWEWRQGNRVYKAVRAVDTATHPDYQGKGIFKKLTLQLVDESKKNGVDFIFNTPNKSSKPGYLKMGWSEYGRMPVSIRPVISFRKSVSDIETNYQIKRQSTLAWLEQYQRFGSSGNSLATNTSSSFFLWRYTDNPNIRYYSFSDADSSFLAIFRIKTGRFGNELRICDFLPELALDRNSLKSELTRVAREFGARFITWSGGLLPLSSLNLKIGPMITVRPLSTNNSLSFDLWKPTLGDMEVF